MFTVLCFHPLIFEQKISSLTARIRLICPIKVSPLSLVELWNQIQAGLLAQESTIFSPSQLSQWIQKNLLFYSGGTAWDLHPTSLFIFIKNPYSIQFCLLSHNHFSFSTVYLAEKLCHFLISPSAASLGFFAFIIAETTAIPAIGLFFNTSIFPSFSPPIATTGSGTAWQI